MAYDPTRQRVVLFGGLRINGPGVQSDLNATWEWNGSTWTQRNPLTFPTPRSATANGFDTAGNRVIAGGGFSQFGLFNDTWDYDPVQKASGSSFGMPCATSFGPLELNPQSLPYVGLDFVQQIDNASPLALVGLLVFGISDQTWGAVPLPLDLVVIGAPGCNLYVSLDVVATVLLTNGSGTNTWTLPNLPSAVGLQVFTQGATLDPASPLPFQIDMSAARAFTIGSP